MTEETTRITGNDADTSTRSANDPSSIVHTTASLPNTYPVQPNCPVHVAWGVIAKVNSPGTSTISDTVFCDTTLTNYVTDVPQAVQSVYNLWSQWAATPGGLGADVEIHWSIKLDNPTAPPPPMGGWVQAKQHLDGHLTYMNVAFDSTGTIPLSSTDSMHAIQTPIMLNIPFLQSIAKY